DAAITVLAGRQIPLNLERACGSGASVLDLHRGYANGLAPLRCRILRVAPKAPQVGQGRGNFASLQFLQAEERSGPRSSPRLLIATSEDVVQPVAPHELASHDT